MIVPPKAEPMKALFRWHPDVIARLDKLAQKTGRSRNEAGELLMRWALQEAEREQELADTGKKR